MSDYVLCLIPETPEFLPSPETIHAFLREIAKLKLGAEATYTIEITLYLLMLAKIGEKSFVLYVRNSCRMNGGPKQWELRGKPSSLF